jgi:hypothetical protein
MILFRVQTVMELAGQRGIRRMKLRLLRRHEILLGEFPAKIVYQIRSSATSASRYTTAPAAAAKDLKRPLAGSVLKRGKWGASVPRSIAQCVIIGLTSIVPSIVMAEHPISPLTCLSEAVERRCSFHGNDAKSSFVVADTLPERCVKICILSNCGANPTDQCVSDCRKQCNVSD